MPAVDAGEAGPRDGGRSADPHPGPVAVAADAAAARPLRPRPEVTVIVPTRNEAGNVAELVQRLGTGLRREAEVLFVDDSDDDTPEAIRRSGRVVPAPVSACCTGRRPSARAAWAGPSPPACAWPRRPGSS